MDHGLRDLARHNAWATDQLLAYCRGLDEPTLAATVPGTYGSILDTLRHLIDAEAGYLYRLAGAWPAHPWRDDEAAGLDVLTERAAVLAEVWERFLAGGWDSDRLGEARGDEGGGLRRPGRGLPRPGAPPRQRAPCPGLHHPRRPWPRAAGRLGLGLRPRHRPDDAQGIAGPARLIGWWELGARRPDGEW